MKKIITFVLVLSMLFCGTFSAIHVSAEENSGNETEYFDYEPAYTPINRIGQNTGSREIIEDEGQDDDRTDVDDVTISPYCKIVFVRSFFYYQGRFIASVRSTGFILGPDLIVTAGHALFGYFKVAENQYEYLQARECFVFLEINGTEPTDSEVIRSVDIYIPNEYLNTANMNRSNYDWGYIIVEEPVGYTQGWFGFGTIAQPHTVTVAGYPDTKPIQAGVNYTMYKGTGQAEPNPYNNMLVKHTVDTTVGQSGSPIYDADQIVWGIHVLGKIDFDGDGIDENWNNGIKINSDIFALLRAKKQEGIERWG